MTKPDKPKDPAPDYVCSGCGCKAEWSFDLGMWMVTMAHTAKCKECNDDWDGMEKRYPNATHSQQYHGMDKYLTFG